MKINWSKILILSGSIILLISLISGFIVPTKDPCGGVCRGSLAKLDSVRLTTFASWINEYYYKRVKPIHCGAVFQYWEASLCKWEFKVFVDALGIDGLLIASGLRMKIKEKKNR